MSALSFILSLYSVGVFGASKKSFPSALLKFFQTLQSFHHKCLKEVRILRTLFVLLIFLRKSRKL